MTVYFVWGNLTRRPVSTANASGMPQWSTSHFRTPLRMCLSFRSPSVQLQSYPQGCVNCQFSFGLQNIHYTWLHRSCCFLPYLLPFQLLWLSVENNLHGFCIVSQRSPKCRPLPTGKEEPGADGAYCSTQGLLYHTAAQPQCSLSLLHVSWNGGTKPAGAADPGSGRPVQRQGRSVVQQGGPRVEQ